jgi:DDE superfamily endonuclease
LKDINTLRQFRHDLYDCFLRAKDALFNTMDALMTETQAKSFPEVSQSLWFERKWPSLYEAFEDGRIDEKHLRAIFARYLPKPAAGKWFWIGIDASSIARPDAVTSADRTAQHVHNLPECKKPVTFGWQFSTLVALAIPTSSWTYILDQQRVASGTTAIEVAYTQLVRLLPFAPANTLVALDRGYDATWLWCRCSGLGIGVLGRLKSNRCFYRVAPLPTGKKGAPRKDGARLQPKDAATHGEPDDTWKGTDENDRRVEVSWWKHMHVKQARWLQVTVLRVVRPHATNKERDPRVSWFVWIGDPEADLAQVALGYALRFEQEHGYRFDKQALLWEQPRLRTPEQFERWSHMVAMVHNHLVLARDLVEPELRPWENKQRQSTPQQVRRGMHKLLARLGTPARPPQPRGKSKGRRSGSRLARQSGFRSFARRQNCLHWSPSNAFADFFIRSGSFHGTSCDVLVRVVSLNVKLSEYFN